MKTILKAGLFLYFLCLSFLGFAQEIPATFREPRFHTTTANNIDGNYTFISLPQDIYTYSRDGRFAMIIKPNPGQKSANPHPVGVWLDIYNKFAWCIYNEDRKAMPPGVTFVYWLMPHGDNVIDVSPSPDGKCIIDHPLTNNNPTAKIYATHRFPTVVGTQSLESYYNNSDLEVVYNPGLGKWELRNQNRTPLVSGAAGIYNVFISPNSSADDKIGEVVNNNMGNVAVVAPPSANAATSTGYSDPTLNTHLRARNDRATLQYLSTLSLEQRIKIQIQSSALMNTVCRRLKRGVETDKDGDGHPAWDIGGDDCDDWNYLVNPSARETCAKDSILQLDGTTIIWMPSLLDEDCNPGTIGPVDLNLQGYIQHGFVQEPSESDRDGDGIASCECFNYGLGALPVFRTTKDAVQKKWESIILVPLKKESSGADFLTHGPDCDDTNPAIVKNSQKCMGENKVAICVKGKWEVKDCRKCVTQPNGTGLVTEW
ncbi:DUF7452 domain-containing protein [Haliscomenobacter sp.]|uniref:DUF7452 domain-containing protein n=1 Tax=Haliscomenobacter sp. TaxID=2717303 RepID=UPI003BAC1C3B